jgi:hypothetical protein
VSNWSDEETDEPLIADHRNFYKVEKWTKDGTKVERMLYAGSNLDKARARNLSPLGAGACAMRDCRPRPRKQPAGCRGFCWTRSLTT